MAEEHKEDRFLVPIEEFIMLETADRWETERVARGDVLAMLATAFSKGMARGDRDLFQSKFNNAKMLYDYFMQTVGQTETILLEGDNRLGMPPWDQLLLASFQAAMTDASVTWAEKMALWESNAPIVQDLKIATYDLIRNQLQSGFERQFSGALTFEEAFAEPPGIEEWRAQRALETDRESGTDDGGLRIERK
ncbi:MAG: hypothetical protein ACOC0P_01400 [Planctomycetota bacterium]